MAIVYWAGDIIRCLSADTKPTVIDGYRLIETDTGAEFIRHAASWKRVDSLVGAYHDYSTSYFDFGQQVAPASPAVGSRRLFVDSADGKLKIRTSAGTNISLEEQGGAGGEIHITLLALITEATF